MKPIIIDQDTGAVLWRIADCASWCNITPGSWRVYAAQQRTPAQVGELDHRTPLWDAEEVKSWHASRPGSPVKNSKGKRA